MKKKLLALFCVITCVFALTACGKEEVSYDVFQKSKISQAEDFSNILNQIAASADTDILADYNKEEMAALLENNVGIQSELGAFDGFLSTYNQMASDMGGIITTGDFTSKIVGKDIVVVCKVYGNDCDGSITFTYTNDIFTRFKEGNAVAKTTISMKLHEAGKHMGDAGLNTLLGMGSVFIVLILICFLISGFTLFKSEPKKQTVTSAPVNAPEVTEELTDDTELVAVIMAAISAYESANGGSADGFVVRSIKKANRRI